MADADPRVSPGHSSRRRRNTRSARHRCHRPPRRGRPASAHCRRARRRCGWIRLAARKLLLLLGRRRGQKAALAVRAALHITHHDEARQLTYVRPAREVLLEALPEDGWQCWPGTAAWQKGAGGAALCWQSMFAGLEDGYAQHSLAAQAAAECKHASRRLLGMSTFAAR